MFTDGMHMGWGGKSTSAAEGAAALRQKVATAAARVQAREELRAQAAAQGKAQAAAQRKAAAEAAARVHAQAAEVAAQAPKTIKPVIPGVGGLGHIALGAVVGLIAAKLLF